MYKNLENGTKCNMLIILTGIQICGLERKLPTLHYSVVNEWIWVDNSYIKNNEIKNKKIFYVLRTRKILFVLLFYLFIFLFESIFGEYCFPENESLLHTSAYCCRFVITKSYILCKRFHLKKLLDLV